ncbi:hypothetical protein L519_0855 [Bordetella bronchiseptica MBORD678]|nr:hypothetical protein L519_0855 [Bordetella bronchiseptica MBORD678]
METSPPLSAAGVTPIYGSNNEVQVASTESNVSARRACRSGTVQAIVELSALVQRGKFRENTNKPDERPACPPARRASRRKKSPRSCDLGLNPPKEEGGGDNRGMSGLRQALRPGNRGSRGIHVCWPWAGGSGTAPSAFQHPMCK